MYVSQIVVFCTTLILIFRLERNTATIIMICCLELIVRVRRGKSFCRLPDLPDLPDLPISDFPLLPDLPDSLPGLEKNEENKNNAAKQTKNIAIGTGIKTKMDEQLTYARGSVEWQS